MNDVGEHNREIHANIANWKRKPLLRSIYRGFHESIALELATQVPGAVVELGSGIANIAEVIPNCIRTDLFPNPWIDQVENAYSLSFPDGGVSNLILFDVFHHLRYPGTALREFRRALAPGGRVILFEPCVSLLGRVVYGLLHREPLGLSKPIQWQAPTGWKPTDVDYYAAQGNASRIFLDREIGIEDQGWSLVRVKRLSSVSYVASGGYSQPQLYPTRALPAMRRLDALLDGLPWAFATRLLVVVEKTTA